MLNKNDSKIETLFNKESFDTRKGNNRAPNKIIPASIVDEISNNGITSERIDKLNVPVYKYKTQITLHGKFPEEINERLFGYKYLILNQNKSLGVKYNAIDIAKKDKIYFYLKESRGWRVIKNSTEFYAQDSYRCDSPAQFKAKAKEWESWISSKDTSFFVGGYKIYSAKNIYTGTVYIVRELHVNAIYEKDVIKLIEDSCSMSYEAIKQNIEKKRREREQELERLRKARQERVKKNNKRLSEEKEKLFKQFGEKVQKQVASEGLYLYPLLNVDDSLRYHLTLLHKTSRQKKLRRSDKSFKSMDELINFLKSYKLSDSPLDDFSWTNNGIFQSNRIEGILITNGLLRWLK